jgi:PucR C-terminal helix-turn-helix domain
VTAHSDRVERLATTLSERRRLLADMARGQALSQAVAHTSRESRLSLWVLTTTGRLVASDADPLPPAHLDAIAATAVTSARLPAVVNPPDDAAAATYTVFDVERGQRRRLARWVIAVSGSADAWPAPTAKAVGELAAIAALEHVRQIDSRSIWRGIADAAVQLIANDDAQQAEVYLRQLGVDVDAPAVVIAAGVNRGSVPLDDVRQLLDDAISSAAEPLLASGGSGEVLALVQPRHKTSDAALLDSLTRSLRRIGPGLRNDRLTVGVSVQATLASLGGAVRAARFARQLAGDTRLPVEVVCDSDLWTARLLLNSVPDLLRTTFADRVLGPVVSYDDRGAGDLIPTLAAFFACDGSWSRTADQLGLHINTVRYRIARIERLTGRSVAQTDECADLYAALTLLRSTG